MGAAKTATIAIETERARADMVERTRLSCWMGRECLE
jgi:hypothetical protein